ncbi:MAG: hypothetical protein ACOX5X_00500 [Acholeplasmataceae bacterium]
MRRIINILSIIILVLSLTTLIGCNDSKAKTRKEAEGIVKEIFDKQPNMFIVEGKDGSIQFQYDAIAGVGLLKKAGYKFDITKLVSKDKVSNYINSQEITNEGDAFKLLQLVRVYDLDVPNSIVQFTKNLTSVPSLWSYPMALSLIANLENNQALLNDILLDVPNVHNNQYFTADTAGFILATAAKYNVDKSTLYQTIERDTTADGVKGWDGTANASATAMAVIGYISNDKTLKINEDIDLLTALINFYDDQKFGFKSSLVAEDIDLMFSTPQSFAALSLYLANLKLKSTPNLYY